MTGARIERRVAAHSAVELSMTESLRTGGLVVSSIAGISCVALKATEWFYAGRWYLAVPLIAAYSWGLIAWSESNEISKRNAALLRKHGIEPMK
jgi:hypothetical protein